ncbi:MAG: helix-turn-helix domain-containing protein [Methylocystis sp.]|uniref:helix-turn-helix domain-containing protein n=1 Tax=Methylocystis sp. TaxID=1911079 RepID=UPI003DA2754C
MEELTRDQYLALQYHFVQFFAEHLAETSVAFNGDLQEMLVLAIVGQVRLRAEEQGRNDAPITASRISDVTAIPRQTVRRKLQSLERRGWVEQIDGGAWQIVMFEDGEAAARRDLSELDRRGIGRIVRFIRAVRAVV